MKEDYFLNKLIDWMDESFEAHHQLGIAVQELRDAIFKELHLEQICKGYFLGIVLLGWLIYSIRFLFKKDK